MEQPQETPPAIEVLPPTHKKHWETKGGDITIFRLRLMTQEEIEAHGLEKYAEYMQDKPQNDTHR